MIHYMAGTGWPRHLDKGVSHIPRIHLYEGRGCPTVFMRDANMQEGDTLIITNTAGSLREDYEPGHIFVIRDHINFAQYTPLKGGDHVNMSDAYDAHLTYDFLNAFLRSTTGVYGFVAGPQFETPAEAEMFARLGADMIGMSTVPEVIYARSKGVRVLGLTYISNYSGDRYSHERVLKMTQADSALLEAAVNVAYETVTK